MSYDEMQKAVDEAKRTIRCADAMVPQMLRLVKGRLRLVELNYNNADVLAALKKELSGFNAVTKTWKEAQP